MPSELAFFSDANSRLLLVDELRAILSDKLGVPCDREPHGTGERLVLGESITLSLTLNKEGVPMSAVAEISLDAKIGHVTGLYKVFRELGWTC